MQHTDFKATQNSTPEVRETWVAYGTNVPICIIIVKKIQGTWVQPGIAGSSVFFWCFGSVFHPHVKPPCLRYSTMDIKNIQASPTLCTGEIDVGWVETYLRKLMEFSLKPLWVRSFLCQRTVATWFSRSLIGCTPAARDETLGKDLKSSQWWVIFWSDSPSLGVSWTQADDFDVSLKKWAFLKVNNTLW